LVIQREQIEGHAMTNGARSNPAGCEAAHPLLEDVRCERLQGHPGKHGAYLNAPSAEMVLEWSDEPPPETATGDGEPGAP
jgi:hypothetical protein